MHTQVIELGGQETIPRQRDRMAGGGRKQTVEIKDKGDIDEIFLSLLKEHTAGDPMDEKVKWTKLATKGFKVSRNIVKKLVTIQCK